MQDLYALINGPWTRTHVIPDDRGVDGAFHQLRDQSEEDVHRIVQEDRGLAGTLYASYMDVTSINAAGCAPLDADLALFRPDNFPRCLGEADRVGVGAPLSFWVEKDSQGGDTTLPYLVQSGLGLPDEAYYRSEEHAETLGVYRKHVARMLGLLGAERVPDPEAWAERVVTLETDLAAGHWDVVARRDAVKTYNPTEFSALPQPVRELLAGAGLGEGRMIATAPSYVEHLAGLLADPDRTEQWRAWFTWRALAARAGALTEEISAANFEFYGTHLQGTTAQRDRWKRAVQTAESAVGEEIGRAFVAEHFPASSKRDMQELVDYLLAAYRERISQLPWMTPATRERALEKLATFRTKIGYPDKWRDYSSLSFSPDGADLLDNLRKAAAFAHDRELAKVGKPADRDEWFMTPQTVNAYYNPLFNEIVFPAAILRPPFYSPEADAAENFGAIGAVIGHEIGHGFDDQGSRYDGEGNLVSWWTDEDRAAFEERTAKLVDQYQGLVPTVVKENGLETSGVNGQFTLGENIGDLGGLGIAVVAYRNWLADHGLTLDTAPKLPYQVEGGDEALAGRTFTGLQRLFFAWARVWRTTIRPQMAVQYLAIDPHSPAEFRCNVTASNVDEFYQAFPEITEDSACWVAPEDRVSIW